MQACETSDTAGFEDRRDEPRMSELFSCNQFRNQGVLTKEEIEEVKKYVKSRYFDQARVFGKIGTGVHVLLQV